MTIRELQAGRELDESVCLAWGIPGRVQWYAQAPGSERAGWIFSDHRREIEEAIADKNRRFPDGWAANSTVQSVTHYPRVSEEIGPAWLVVEQLRQHGWLVRVQEMPDGHPYLGPDDMDPQPKIYRRAHCLLTWMRREGPEGLRTYIHTHPFALADSVPLAICRAALLAKETTP